MRCPKCNATVEQHALTCSVCRMVLPSRQRAAEVAARSDSPPPAPAQHEHPPAPAPNDHPPAPDPNDPAAVAPEREPEKRLVLSGWHVAAVVAFTLPLILYGAYSLALYITFAHAADRTSPEAHVLGLVRNAPSGAQGKTVAEYAGELTEARKAQGMIEEVEGWYLVPQSSSSWLVTYAYQDRDPTINKREARWSVDLAGGHVEPLNEWARELMAPAH